MKYLTDKQQDHDVLTGRPTDARAWPTDEIAMPEFMAAWNNDLAAVRRVCGRPEG